MENQTISMDLVEKLVAHERNFDNIEQSFNEINDIFGKISTDMQGNFDKIVEVSKKVSELDSEIRGVKRLISVGICVGFVYFYKKYRDKKVEKSTEN